MSRRHRLAKFSALLLAAAVFGLSSFARPAAAQKLPTQEMQELLIKTTLLTFNDANVTGIYEVLHAKLSKPFRDQFPPERLKEGFKVFHEKHIDIDIIAIKTPVASEESKIDEKGILHLQGYFEVGPSRVIYQLGYIMSDGEWKPIAINVNVKPNEKK
jgi:hypothetical protein